ncbi:spore coat protein CotJB [Blautia sp. HCP3S3_G3]|uniref:spore coat protein CotJB n=1 Tax=Blautia sp. HCP3S3_G3 TaxID=3438913 RepID=UPI003F8BDE71
MMSENRSLNQKQLLQEINEVSFAVNDIHLFLDTHPCDKQAMDFFKTVASRRRELMTLYAREFGPLTVDDALETDSDTWKWMEQPFPWEQEGGLK